MGQLLHFPPPTLEAPEPPAVPRGPAKVECLHQHEIILGPYWSLGVKVLVCIRCRREWIKEGTGRYVPVDEKDDLFA